MASWAGDGWWRTYCDRVFNSAGDHDVYFFVSGKGLLRIMYEHLPAFFFCGSTYSSKFGLTKAVHCLIAPWTLVKLVSLSTYQEKGLVKLLSTTVLCVSGHYDSLLLVTIILSLQKRGTVEPTSPSKANVCIRVDKYLHV